MKRPLSMGIWKGKKKIGLLILDLEYLFKQAKLKKKEKFELDLKVIFSKFEGISKLYSKI